MKEILRNGEKMNQLLAIGEALIDFIAADRNMGIQDVTGFQPAVGGAPANVCGAFVKLGGSAALLTQLGADPFGDKIMAEFARQGIGTDYVLRTDKANTALAFVALQEDGNREFSFYRNPSADMLFAPEDVKKEWFADAYALHFCSVSLGEYPMKQAHERAIEYALEQGVLVSFDPNLRKALWKSEEALKRTVLEFIPRAHVLKLSDEELFFLTGTDRIEAALPQLFTGNVALVIYTMGAGGARCFTGAGQAGVPGEQVKAVDTTGAGDGFIGAFLYQLYAHGIHAADLPGLSEKELEAYLRFANRFSAYSVQHKGAISSYPSRSMMEII